MRIAITRAGSAFGLDGINFFIWELADEFIRRGHEVYVISGCDGHGEDIGKMFGIYENPTILVLKEHTSLGWTPLPWLYKGLHVLAKVAPDMLICNGAVPVCHKFFKAVVCHDLEFRQRFQRWYSVLVYKMFDKVVTTSIELRDSLPYELRLKPSNVSLIPICVPTQKYQPLNLENRENAILHVGTWSDKNLETTLRAFTLVSQKDPTIKLYVAGDIRFAHATLSRFKQEVTKRVVCLGKTSKTELKEIYSRVRVTCAPSIYRVPVLSPTVLESLASGTPVIGSSSGISRDLLINDFNGFRIGPRDAVSIAKKVSVLTRNDELWKRMSENSLHLVKSFDTTVVARKYIELYETWSASPSCKLNVNRQ